MPPRGYPRGVVQDGGEHIDINNISSGSDDEADDMQPRHPRDPGVPGAAAANVAVRRGPVATSEEMQAEIHTSQARASELEKQNRQLRESLQFMQNEVNAQRRDGESKFPPELKPVNNILHQCAVVYATRCRPWVPDTVFEPPPSWDIDPLDFNQRFPSEPGRSANALKHAYSAELYKLMDAALLPYLDNAWVRARFIALALHRKSNMVNNAKGHLSEIFASLHDPDLVIPKNESDKEKHPRCKYWRGEPGDEHPPIMYAPGHHGDLRYVFQNMAIVDFIKIALFGNGALRVENGKYDGKCFARRHKITTLDHHMIAFAVTVLRFFLSHDAHFEERGKQSGIPFAEFYDKTFKALLEYQDNEWLSKTLGWLHQQVFGTPLAHNSGGTVNGPSPDVLTDTGRQIRWEDLRTLARPQADDLEYASAPVMRPDALAPIARPDAPAPVARPDAPTPVTRPDVPALVTRPDVPALVTRPDAPAPATLSVAPALSWASLRPHDESISGGPAPPGPPPIPTSTRPSLDRVHFEHHAHASSSPAPRLPPPPGLRLAGTGHWAVAPRPAGASSATVSDPNVEAMLLNSDATSEQLITPLNEITLTGLPSTNVLSNGGAPGGVMSHGGGVMHLGSGGPDGSASDGVMSSGEVVPHGPGVTPNGDAPNGGAPVSDTVNGGAHHRDGPSPASAKRQRGGRPRVPPVEPTRRSLRTAAAQPNNS